MIGRQVVVDVYVNDSSIGHYEPRRGKVVAGREITRKRWRQPEQKVRQYAVELAKGKMVWRDVDNIAVTGKRG